MPERIQRQRTKGWRMPDGAIYVGRPTLWGNPYTLTMMQERIDQIAAAMGTDATLDARVMAVEAFRCDLTYGPDSIWWWYGPHSQIIRIKGALDRGELHGHDLACWCPLVDGNGCAVPCHADVLLELANAPS